MTQQQPYNELPDFSLLTPAEVKQILEEIQEWLKTVPDSETYEVACFVHLRDMPVDAYEVVYKDGYAQVYFRHENGKLEPAESLAYYPPKKEAE